MWDESKPFGGDIDEEAEAAIMRNYKEKYAHSTGRRYRPRVNAKAVRKSAARLKVRRG